MKQSIFFSSGKPRSMSHFMVVLLVRLLIGAVLLLLWNEFIVYYLVLLGCGWPSTPGESPQKVMLLADTHLLGSRRGHWWDKLRREWQMRRAFQTAMTLFNPSSVFVLGDLFDEGKWSSDAEFQSTVERFRYMFATPPNTKLYAAVGNHDIGFHYDVTAHKSRRFDVAMNSSPVKLVSRLGVHYVLVNSMAFEGDQCKLCAKAQQQLLDIRTRLDCWKNPNSSVTCELHKKKKYSRPILLQHYPLFRTSDANCTGDDSAPDSEKFVQMKPRWECLSQEASQQLLSWLRPRLVVDGHTHHWCHVTHSSSVEELTIPSFSWRNKRNPSFLLLTVNTEDYSWSKCYMPDEDTVINVYICGILALLLMLAVQPWIAAMRRFRDGSRKTR